jgi:hypothetical protein
VKASGSAELGARWGTEFGLLSKPDDWAMARMLPFDHQLVY